MAPNALQAYRTARAQLSVPLLPAAGEGQGSSAVPSALPHQTPHGFTGSRCEGKQDGGECTGHSHT